MRWGFTRWNGYFDFEIGQKLEKILKKNREILIMKIQQNGLRRKSYEDYVMRQLLFQNEI